MNIISGKIRVCNYGKSPVGFPSSYINNRNGNFAPAKEDGEECSITRILWEDVEEENSKSDIFRTGLLRFMPEEEDEIYEKLGITDKENIKTDRDIHKMLIDTSVENLKKIGNINSATLLTRIKCKLYELEKTEPNININVITVINEKYNEMFGGIKNENSFINTLINRENKDKQDNSLKDMVDKLSSDLESLKQEKVDSDTQSQIALSDLLKMVQDLKAENEQLKNITSTNDKLVENAVEEKTSVKTTKVKKETIENKI